MIEAVIVGDWRQCAELLNELAFEDYEPTRQRFGPMYADFRLIGYAVLQRSVAPKNARN